MMWCYDSELRSPIRISRTLRLISKNSYKGAETAFAVVFNTVLMHPGPTTFFMQEPISCFFYYNTIALLYQTLYFIEISKILNIVFLWNYQVIKLVAVTILVGWLFVSVGSYHISCIFFCLSLTGTWICKVGQQSVVG